MTISKKTQGIASRQIIEKDAMDAHAAVGDNLHTDELAAWVMKKRLQLNSLMEQAQIDELGTQLDGLNSEQQRAVVERWIDAYSFESLAETFKAEKQGFAVLVCRKIARRLRYPHSYENNLAYAEKEAIGLAAAYPRHRDEIERMFLATPDALYQIAVLFDDVDSVPFESEDKSSLLWEGEQVERLE